MTDNRTVRRYLRAVSRRLRCRRETRRRLLAGLRQELEPYAALDFQALCGTVGTPAQAASQLMEAVGRDEVRAVKRKRHVMLACVVAVLAAALLLCGGYALDMYMKFGRPGTYTIVITDEGEW